MTADDEPGSGRTSKTLINGLLLVGVMAPSFVASWFLFEACPASGGRCESLAASIDCFCAVGLDQPIVAVNLLFFVNVTVGFWLISLVQRSTWLIDPYWTILPVLIGHFYAAHPQASGHSLREGLALALIWIWSLRLTHNYFRREGWRLGAREDWRFARKRRSARHFWWYSFFYAFLSQQVMLVGLTLPLWAVSFHPAPLSLWDAFFALGALTGIVIAGVADNQLRAFMIDQTARRRRGDDAPRLLDHGLWRYSRHPNYFGEQLFWWSLAGFGVVVGEPWVVIGPLFNSIVLAVVTVMVERRMLAVKARRQLYESYRRRTSALVPWPPRRDRRL